MSFGTYQRKKGSSSQGAIRLSRDALSSLQILCQILLPVWVVICLATPVEWRPLWVFLEQPHGLDVLEPDINTLLCFKSSVTSYTYVLLISGEPMVNPRRQNNQIALLEPNPHPVIPFAPDIEVTRTVKNISDFLVLM